MATEQTKTKGMELLTIPCLSDNYAFLMHDPHSGDTAVVDVPESGPVLDALTQTGWRLSHIFLTHHHYDHVDGLEGVKAAYPEALVIGAADDAERLPPLDIKLRQGDTVTLGGETVQVIDVPGHTVGHIAFHFPDSGVLFSGDSLMALGCGRLFEGTPDQMYTSLSTLAALPADTIICSGHEYTASNARFAASIEPGNNALGARAAEIDRLRSKGRFTVPSTLRDELETNPFLRAHIPSVQKAVGMEGATPAAVFAEIRKRKDNF